MPVCTVEACAAWADRQEDLKEAAISDDVLVLLRRVNCRRRYAFAWHLNPAAAA
jgi:hypothetical protein